jgi:sigma-B regulation protein RsbQ
VEPAFVDDFKTVLFDHVGAGGSGLTAYDHSNIRAWQGMPTMSLRSGASSI